jgi:copper chaperone CopZ
MTHTYKLTGMTCGNCEATVKSKLLSIPGVTDATLSHQADSASITMDNHISISDLQQAIGGKQGRYQISALTPLADVPEVSSWLVTYKPILLVFAFIIGVTMTVQMTQPTLDFMEWMRHFMAGFFMVFAFFKMLDLAGFASSYAQYDVVARNFAAWGYIYPFIELTLGLAYLGNFNPVLTNTTTFVVMTVSLVGVMQSVLNKRKIKCACLGTGFNLPMSTVTIIEDGLMIVMSAVMLSMYL